MKKLRNIHPGEVLQEEFLAPLKISAYRLSKETKIPYPKLLQIVKYKGGITAEIALRLGLYFGTTPKFWLGLQADFDIEETRELKKDELVDIRMHSNNAA